MGIRKVERHLSPCHRLITRTPASSCQATSICLSSSRASPNEWRREPARPGRTMQKSWHGLDGNAQSRGEALYKAVDCTPVHLEDICAEVDGARTFGSGHSRSPPRWERRARVAVANAVYGVWFLVGPWRFEKHERVHVARRFQ